MAHTVSLNQYAVRKRHLFDWRLLKEHETEPASALNPKSVAKLVVPDLEQTAGFANNFRSEMAAIFARFDAADC